MFGSGLFTFIHWLKFPIFFFRFCLCTLGFGLVLKTFFQSILHSEGVLKLFFFIEDGKSSDKNSEDYEKNISELFELVDKNKSKTIDLDELKLLSPKMPCVVAISEKNI